MVAEHLGCYAAKACASACLAGKEKSCAEAVAQGDRKLKQDIATTISMNPVLFNSFPSQRDELQDKGFTASARDWYREHGCRKLSLCEKA